MNCYTCNKQIEKDALKCGLSVQRKDNGRFDTCFECAKCHEKRWNAKHLEDLKAIASECKSKAQLTAAFKECGFVQRWKNSQPELIEQVLDIYEARAKCFA